MTGNRTLSPLLPLYILDPGNFTHTYDINLASALAKRGWKPRLVFSPNFRDELILPDTISVLEAFFRFMRSPVLGRLANHSSLRRIMKFVSYPYYLVALSNSLLTEKPGILHVQWALIPLLDMLFWRRWKKQGWTLVYTAHDPKPLAGTLPRALTWQQPRLWLEADDVIVHSMEGADIIRRSGIGEDFLHIIPPGPPTTSSPVPCSEARIALNLPLNIPIILFFGYVKKYKGLEFLLRSLPIIQENCGPFLCLIAGEFKEPPGFYRRLISKLNLKHKPRLIESYIPNRSMALYFSACDVVALPYLEASSSGVLLCANSFGKPVVTTATGGNLELVENGRSGYLVPPKDVNALANSLSATLKDPTNAQRMGAYAKKKIECRHSWGQIAQCTEKIYLQAKAERQASPVIVDAAAGKKS